MARCRCATPACSWCCSRGDCVDYTFAFTPAWSHVVHVVSWTMQERLLVSCRSALEVFGSHWSLHLVAVAAQADASPVPLCLSGHGERMMR